MSSLLRTKLFLFSLINICVLFVIYKNYFMFINLYVLEWVVLIVSICYINYLGLVNFFKINIYCSFLFTLSCFSNFLNYNIYQFNILVNIGNFFKISYGSTISITFFIDFLNYNFSLLTALIAFSVYLYVYVYMRFELNIINFFFFLKTFVLSMILLLWAGNWVTLILGWELIGVTSFLLINFWTNKITTLKSAFKAFTFNKISDCFLMISFFLSQKLSSVYFFNFYSNIMLFCYKYVYICFCYVSYLDVLLFCLIICSFCKSAQFGFHFWLPDSMEAPVPASSLIHSATLVSAGIYLLLRFNFLFLYTGLLYYFFFLITAFTALYGAIIASFQTDVKKILAYSTISHCGFLMISILTFNPYVTLLYLFGHGFFKSLNFMCVGNFIVFSNNYQDLRKMGNYYYFNKFEFFILFITIFNLGSLPFFFNFFSKHFLLNFVSLNFVFINFINIVIYLAAFCGLVYSLRLFYYSCLSFKKNHYSYYLIKNLKNNSFYKLFFTTSKLNILSILILIIFTIIVIVFFMKIFFHQITCLIDVFNFKPMLEYLNLSNFLVKVFFFNCLLNLSYLIFFFKKKNIFISSYIWIYYIFIIIC